MSWILLKAFRWCCVPLLLAMLACSGGNNSTNDGANDDGTLIAAGYVLDTSHIGSYPNNAYAWAALNLLPQWEQYWTDNYNMLTSRYSRVKIIAYHSGCIIKKSFIPQYDVLSHTIDPSASWSDTFYLKSGGQQISFDGGGDLFYADITNPAARTYMVRVAQGMMRRFKNKTGHNLSGVFLDMVEWQPRANAAAILSENTYRARMNDLFSEMRQAITSENPSAELGGNAGAIHDHSDYSLLESLDTVLAENAFGNLFGDTSAEIQSFLQYFQNRQKKPVLVLAIDGDNAGCPSNNRWVAASSFATKYPGSILISADYGPSAHGNLDCYEPDYLIK